MTVRGYAIPFQYTAGEETMQRELGLRFNLKQFIEIVQINTLIHRNTSKHMYVKYLNDISLRSTLCTALRRHRHGWVEDITIL